jgi:uncharacterized protein YjbI with pentapeptide repeats
MAGPRRSLEESWAFFEGEPGKWAPAVDGQGRPLLLDHHAGVWREEDPVDIMFFRSGYRDAVLADLTLPRRHINRSDFQRVSFRNTDLNQSFMCWNDFIDCDFTDADLTCCDMRASIFRNCSFVRCKLVGADLRRSTFENCDFTGADVTGAKKAWDQDIDNLDHVADEETTLMDVREDDGPQPKGG